MKILILNGLESAQNSSGNVQSKKLKSCVIVSLTKENSIFQLVCLHEFLTSSSAVHEARIRDTLVDKMTHGQTASRVYEERLLEENLTLQLNLLKQEMPDSALFPVDKMKVPESTESTPPRNNQAMNLLNENTLESLVICAVFGLMLFVAPHI